MKKTICNICVSPRFTPELDPDFIPFPEFIKEFLKTAEEPFAIGLERDGGQIQVFDTFVHGTPEMFEADCLYAERLTKFMLYARGGFRIFVCGNEQIFHYIAKTYAAKGARAFDNEFMHTVYSRPVEVVYRVYADKPAVYQKSVSIGRHLNGCRIGFDAGGSDRKVSAVIDGEPVFSEETVWNPKTNPDPQYHFDGILDSFRKAAAHMPRVDGIGVSSAGVYVENQPKVASLFMSVPRELYPSKVDNIYMDAAKALDPHVPIVVCNDGDVTALAGAMSLQKNAVLGIAMGTSEAGGYVDEKGNITGWLNELAFTPVDLAPSAMRDEWSGDIGCGVKYFSQDGVIKLAPVAGIQLTPQDTPANKLKVVQGLMAEDDPRARKIYESIGVYLAYALKLYSIFYAIDEVLLLGRVVSGDGGSILLSKTQEVLAAEYPELMMNVSLPSEATRRVGQSVAAASLPEIK